VLGELPRSVVGWDRVRTVLDATGEMPYGTRELVGTGPARLRLDDVRFEYEEGTPVLSGVELDLEPGRVVAVVGATGAGKSTLTSLLTRLVDPASGRVLVDEVDVRDLTHGSLAEHVAVVPQSTFLFDDSVRENVTLGADVPDDDVWAALRTVQADGFVSALPRGLDTQLGERGTTLSGGQRQRLALARALVRRPRLLVMDDATSAVDPEVEQRILAALAEHTADDDGPSVLVVAYRKATIALADEVVFLDGGRIVDRGTHAELIERSADYRLLVDAYDQAREAASDGGTGPWAADERGGPA
jgi:ABC-type multidrug transport system fused ATPase/permease subunit